MLSVGENGLRSALDKALMLHTDAEAWSVAGCCPVVAVLARCLKYVQAWAPEFPVANENHRATEQLLSGYDDDPLTGIGSVVPACSLSSREYFGLARWRWGDGRLGYGNLALREPK